MKIVAAFTLIGKGDILLTDQPFSSKLVRQLRSKRKLRCFDDDQSVEISVKSTEPAKRSEGEFVSFVVPSIDDSTRAFIVGREYVLE